MEEIIAILVGGATTAMLFVFKEKYKNKKTRNIASKLEFHFLFTHIDNKISWLENEFTYPDKGREILVKTVLIKKLTIWHDVLEELNKEVDRCYSKCDSGKIGTCTKLYDRNMKYFNQIIKEYRTFYENDNYSEKEKELFRKFMRQLNQHLTPEFNRVKKWIYRVTHSTFYNDCKSIQASIDNEWVSAVDTIMIDVEDTIAKLNGGITGYEINGVVIGEVVHKIN